MSEISPALRHELDLSWVGAHFASILYGIFIVLTIANIHCLWLKRDRIFLPYTVILFISTTVYYAVAINLEQTELIDDPQSTLNYPLSKDLVVQSLWLVDQTLVDGLLVYRCYVIWLDYKGILILPFALFISSFASYVALLIAIAQREGSNWTTKSVSDLNTLSWSLSTAVEVVAAIMIAGRLMHRYVMLKNHVGQRVLRGYSNAFAIILESATIYAIAGVVTIAFVARRSQLLAVFVPIFGLIQSITPNLILYRINKIGSSVHSTTKQRTEPAFASPTQLSTTRTLNISSGSTDSSEV